VANVVIRDDELPTLIDAIAQGRTIYRNIRRALEFLVTTNMSEIGVSLVEVLHGPNELETPLEILWINLVTDVLPGLGLAMADPDPDVMTRPPRGRDEHVVPSRDFRRMALDGGTIMASTLVAHFIGLARYGAGPQTRGMTFMALSLGQLLYTLTCQRSDVRKLRPDRLFENRALDGALVTSIGLAILPFAVRPLGRLLGVARLGPGDTAVSLVAAVLPAATVLMRRGVLIELVPEPEPFPEEKG
jgi:Ca2+-transporting ATPase